MRDLGCPDALDGLQGAARRGRSGETWPGTPHLPASNPSRTCDVAPWARTGAGRGHPAGPAPSCTRTRRATPGCSHPGRGRREADGGVTGAEGCTSASGPRPLPARHGHLQHGADPAPGHRLQQLCEVGKALWRGLHLPLEPELGMRGARPPRPEVSPTPTSHRARPSPRGPQWLSQTLPRSAPAQDQTAGRAGREGVKGGPSERPSRPQDLFFSMQWGVGGPHTHTQSPQKPGAAARAGRQPGSRHFPSRPAAVRVRVGPRRASCGVVPPPDARALG